MSTRSLATALAIALVLGGCSDPYADSPRKRGSRPDRTPEGELPGRIPGQDRRALDRPQTQPASTAQAALRRHARLVTNWTAETIQSRFREAARAAVGQARRDAEQTAATAGVDSQLTAGDTASEAKLVAIVPQRDGWALILTREQLTPDAGPARYRIYRAHTRPVPGGIAVDAWQPQP